MNFYLLRSMFHELQLYIFLSITRHNLPDEMNMVCHDDKAMYPHYFIFNQVLQAFYNDVFPFIIFQQGKPMKVGGSKEMWPLCWVL